MAEAKVEETSGAASSNNTTNNEETETKTGGDSNMIKGDVILSLRGIPEYDQYPYNKGKEKFLFMASIKAPLFKQKDDRSAIDLVCVIDESGSMSMDGKIDLVKETLNFLITNLTKHDRLGLVGYGSSSRIILSLTN
eukprot:282915_1